MTSNRGDPFDFWHVPASIERNNFKFKSLSSWAFNIAVGCGHACRFCYVPSASTIKQGPALAGYGVSDPDAQWGEYALLRPFDEKVFMASLKKAEQTDPGTLNSDGNRAVIYCSTTDAYQVFRGSTQEKQKLLSASARTIVRRSLELILKHSTLNVRILTRSPMAEKDFELFKEFGNRLLFGMSLPTLDNALAKIYEPKAPAPSQRLRTLQKARDAGLNVYVAVAPTYPECGEDDLRKTLTAVAKLKPCTIYHEPINIRAENVERIAVHARSLNVKLNTAVFDGGPNWRKYAVEQLMTVQRLACELGIEDRLHLWPDKSLKAKGPFLDARNSEFLRIYPSALETSFQREQRRRNDEVQFTDFSLWLDYWHQRISEWPGKTL